MYWSTVLVRSVLNKLRLFHQTRQLSSVRLSFLNIKPTEKQDKPPVLIYHGLFGNKNNWKSIASNLADETGRQVFLFDLRNHGDSPHVDGKKSDLVAMAGDVQLFLDENAFEKACLIGHSLGGRVVMQFAFLNSQRIEKLIPVDITPKSTLPPAFFMAPDFIDNLKHAISGLEANASLSDARRTADDRLKSVISDKFTRGFFLMSLTKTENGIKWKYNLDGIKTMINSGYLNKIKIEKSFQGAVMVLHGENSHYVRTQDYDQIRNVFPNAVIKSIIGCGHYLHIEKPKTVLNRLVNFINEEYL